MSKYITKIQLQNADEMDYQKLQNELESKSFKTELHAAKSKAYLLGLEVFYSIEGNLSLQDVINAVRECLNNISIQSSFFVMKDKHLQGFNY